MIMLKAMLSDIAKPRTGRVRPSSQISDPIITLVMLPEPNLGKLSRAESNSSLEVSKSGEETMAQLLPFINTRPQFEIASPSAPPNPPAPPFPPSKDVKASPRKALLVENDASLLNILRASLKNEGYEVNAAANSEEGLRLYQDCAPFNVVVIDYYVPQQNGDLIDCLAQQTKGTALASEILKSNPSQGIIIAAFDYRNAGEIKLEGELKHIPLLLDTSNSQLRRVLEIIEVHRAMDALTPAELLRLQTFADYRIRGLGRAARGRTGEDLLRHAMMRTLIGAGSTRDGRHWNKHVDLVWHLTGAMRGISSNWNREFKENEKQPYRMKEPHLMSELLKCDADGQEFSPLYNREAGRISSSGSWEPDVLTDERLIEKDEENRVLAKVKDDNQATQVLHGLLEGLKKKDIMSQFDLSEKQYAAVVKRILRRLGRENGGS